MFNPTTNVTLSSQNAPNYNFTSSFAQNSTLANLNQTRQNQEIQVAAYNIASKLSDKMGHLYKNTFNGLAQVWNDFSRWWKDSSPRAKDIAPQIKRIQTQQKADLEESFYQRLQIVMDDWDNQKGKALLLETIEQYLALSFHKDKNSARAWIDANLKENLSSSEVEELQQALLQKQSGQGFQRTLKAKRDISSVSYQPVISEKASLETDGSVTWDESSLCVSGEEGILYGATNTNLQKVQLFSIQNDVINRIASAGISSQFPSRRGSNFVESACRNGLYHFVIRDNIGDYDWYTFIAHQTFIIQTAISPAPTMGQRAWRPAKLAGNNSIIAPAYGTQYNLLFSNDSNPSGIPNRGFNVYQATASLVDNLVQGILSFVNGNSLLLQNRYDAPRGLYAWPFNTYSQPTGSLTNTNLDLTIFDQLLTVPLASKTPLAVGTPYTTLIAPRTDSSVSLFTLDLNTQQIASHRLLDGSIPNAKLSIANCEDLPNIHAYARDAIVESKYVIKFDVVDSNQDSHSVINGEQTYDNFNLSSPVKAEIGCFSNGVFVLTFLEDGHPNGVSIKLVPQNPPTNPPNLTPTPTSSPLSTPPSGGATIVVNIPPGLGDTFVPITGQILSVSENTATIQLIDDKGFKIVFTANLTLVPLHVQFSSEHATDGTFSIAKGTATEGDAPIFEGCTGTGECSTSTVGQGLTQTFNVEGVNLKLIIPLAVGIPAVAVLVAGIIWKVWYGPLRQQRIARYNQTAKAQQEDL